MDSSQGKGEFKSMEKRVLGTRPPPHKDRVVLNCPRCNSPNTKFCYYNNYSMSQPRYFCKSCRRYWTEGGTLRNVPIGGGSRKNRRAFPLPRSSSCTTSTSSSRSFPCPPKAVSAPVNCFLSGAPGSLSSRNPSFGLRDLALAGNVLLPGTLPLPTEKFLEHGRSGAAFPDSATETGVSPVGLAIGSPSLTVTPHFTTPAAVEPLVFPFDFPLEAAMQRICGGGMDTRGQMELQVGGVGDEELQTQGDQSNNHQGLWGGGGGGGGGYLGAGPW